MLWIKINNNYYYLGEILFVSLTTIYLFIGGSVFEPEVITPQTRQHLSSLRGRRQLVSGVTRYCTKSCQREGDDSDSGVNNSRVSWVWQVSTVHQNINYTVPYTVSYRLYFLLLPESCYQTTFFRKWTVWITSMVVTSKKLQ